jgi:hypothetical protein
VSIYIAHTNIEAALADYRLTNPDMVTKYGSAWLKGPLRVAMQNGLDAGDAIVIIDGGWGYASKTDLRTHEVIHAEA